MGTPAVAPELAGAARRLFAGDGVPVSWLRDSAGFVAQRVVAMVVAIRAMVLAGAGAMVMPPKRMAAMVAIAVIGVAAMVRPMRAGPIAAFLVL
jgi:hypothetical protein